MNAMQARIDEIVSDDFFNIVKLTIQNFSIKLLKTKLPSWVEIGEIVECQIQEASLAVCKGAHEGNVSIENRFEGTIVKFLEGDVLTEVTLNTPCGEVKSLISTEAKKRMALQKGEEVTLLLKMVDVKIAPTTTLSNLIDGN